MTKSLPPLTWFRTFEAAARHLSFTAAANEIGMTQSAVSQQIKALETRLRVALFTRHARGLSLTDNGRSLLPQVGAALEKLAFATEAFDAGPTADQLTIATSVSVAQWVITPHLASFMSNHPDVRLRFLSAIWPDDFHTARADVEIRFGSQKQVGKNAELLEPSRLVALKSPRLEGKLEELPLIETVGTSSGWRAWGEVFPGCSAPSIFADSYGMALQIAMHGNGVALVNELLAGNAIKEGLLVQAHLASITGQEGYYLSINEINANAVSFRDWLHRQLVR
ncbi:glycine cleavage system transcriptional activator [Roseibium sp. TrichSKD4]|uniref:LysR family transcriptional regulator n=1 Tax=Roseibium sp. TrichSKD4 TaxID=744980 RepID=UPI0001E561DC|nr:LysR family transcriptional regulator [Roseibium sp. TrichSKD4]EFO32940.1 glycine cleavage system transcriptional activator [Roseibium sp. TrichSKD4]